MSSDTIDQTDLLDMDGEEMRAFLTEQGVGVLGLLDEEVPYLVPLSFGFDGESTLYFVFLLFGSESRKERLAGRTRRGRFLVYSATSVHEWRSVSLVGDLEVVPDDEWPALRAAMENAWYPDLFSAADPMRGIEGYRFRIDEWSGIRSKV